MNTQIENPKKILDNPNTQKDNSLTTDNFNMKSEKEKVFRYSINKSGKNKDFDKEKLTTDFQVTSGTLENVRQDVLNGFALCAGILREPTDSDKKGLVRRKSSNIIGSHWVLIDIDNKDFKTDGEGNRLDKDGLITQMRKIDDKGNEKFVWVDLDGKPHFETTPTGKRVSKCHSINGVKRERAYKYSKALPLKMLSIPLLSKNMGRLSIRQPAILMIGTNSE